MVKIGSYLWRTRILLLLKFGKVKLRKIVVFSLALFGCFTVFSSRSGETSWWIPSIDGETRYITSVIDTNATRPEYYWIHVARGPECSKARPQKRGTLPLVNLLSIHGSGNTWLRLLIERATGLCTGSLYADTELRVVGLNCEDYVTPHLFKYTIAVKSHYYSQLNASKVILLIRNPYDAIISDYNREKTYNNHTGTADVSEFHSNDFQTFAQARADEWLAEIQITFSSASEVFVIFYENIKYNLKSILQQTATFLRVSVPESRMDCAVRSQLDRAKRRHRPLPDDVWPPYLTVIIDGIICQAHSIFQQQKFVDLPEFYGRSCR